MKPSFEGYLNKMIVGSRKTKKTDKLLRELEPEDLKEIIFNHGLSSFPEYNYIGRKIINRVSAIRNCVDKKRMFRCFARYGVKSLEFFDLSIPQDRRKAIFRLLQRKELCLRRGRKIEIVGSIWRFRRIFRRYIYATTKVDKKTEWRILTLFDIPMRVFQKIGDEFALHLDNCEFKIDNNCPESVINEALKASKACGIDMAGVDICLTTDNKVKVIEVNSGPGMSENSIEKLFRLIRMLKRKVGVI